MLSWFLQILSSPDSSGLHRNTGCPASPFSSRIHNPLLIRRFYSADTGKERYHRRKGPAVLLSAEPAQSFWRSSEFCEVFCHDTSCCIQMATTGLLPFWKLWWDDGDFSHKVTAPAAGRHLQITFGGFQTTTCGDHRKCRFSDEFLAVKQVGHPVKHPFQSAGYLTGIHRWGENNSVCQQQPFFQVFKIILTGTPVFPFLICLYPTLDKVKRILV